MKRIWSALLCAVLITISLTPYASAAAVGYTPGTARGFALSAVRGQDKARTNLVEASGPEMLAALESFLEAAGRETAKPANAVELARINFAISDDVAETYTLAMAGDAFYLLHGSTCQSVEYNAFESLAKQAGFYKYYDLPTATVAANSAQAANTALTMRVYSHNYSYRSLNGTYYRRVTSPDTATPALPAGAALKKLSYSQTPDSVAYTVYQGDKQVWSGAESEIAAFKPQAGAEYLVRIRAKYNDSGSCRGWVEYAYSIGGKSTADAAASGSAASISAGGVTFSAEGSDTYPGELVVLKVTGAPAGQKATATSSVEISPTFFRKDADTQVALLPVSVYVGAGSHWVDVTCAGETTRLQIVSKDKKFEVQHLTVSASTTEQTILSQQANAEYEKAIAPIRPIADDEQYWDGRFVMPVSDKNVTTSFGLMRYTNGSSTATRHNALDLAVPRGTNVAASGNGRVVYSGFLQLTGNTIVIEHGYGLKSWHYHMDSRAVSAGDMVTQGDIIGTVGSTGFSTGPHLHFSMSVNSVFVNPYTLINTDLLAL